MKKTTTPIKDMLSRYKKLIGIVLLVAVFTVGFKSGNTTTTANAEVTGSDYLVPFNQMTNTIRLMHPATGSVLNDSILVVNASGRWVRKIAPLSSWLSSYATTASLSGYATTATLGNYATTASLSGYVSTSGSYANPSWITSLAYSKLTGAPASTTFTQGTGINISSGVITNTAPDQNVTLTAGNRISITGTYPNFTIAYVEPTPTLVTRTVNTNYTISTTKQASVVYSITTSVTNPLLVGTSVGTAYLEYSLNAGTTWINPSTVGNSNGVGVAVAVALTNGQTTALGGVIPANALVRIRTVVSGTATVVYAAGQETY